MKIKGFEIRDTLPVLHWMGNNARSLWSGLALIIIMGLVGSLSGVAAAVTSKHMVDNAVKGDLCWAGIFAAIFGALLLMNLGMNISGSLVATRVSEAMSNSMREKIFSELIMTEWMQLSVYHSGDLLTRLTSDVSAVTGCIVNTLPSILFLGVQFIAAFATLLYYEPKLAFLAFALGPATVFLSRLWSRKLKELNIRAKESESAYRSYLQENMQNFSLIKSFRLEEHNQKALQELHNNRMSWVLKLNRATLTASAILSGGFMSSYFVAFVWGTYRLAQNAISFGTLTAFLQLVSQVQGPFIGLTRTLPQVIAGMASAERLIELEEMERERPTEPVPALSSLGISFNKTAFSYDDEQEVLVNASAKIHPGEIVALVGTSGEGKTTMIRLLLALLRPNDGTVSFFDAEGQVYPASVSTREWITYVPQGNTLFSGTIADNIRYGKPDSTYEEMEKAAQDACAWNFIKKLPEGFDTVIGEKGLGLSEGQAQRIAIARAFLRQVPILILDEATSALDTQSEMYILNSIKNLGRTCTCLIITHRSSALKICSRIIKLQDGYLIEETA